MSRCGQARRAASARPSVVVPDPDVDLRGHRGPREVSPEGSASGPGGDGGGGENRTHGIRVLQTRALPLGYAALTPAGERAMERETGFEPATPTLARLCSTTELFPRPALVTRRRILSREPIPPPRAARRPP